MVNKMKVVLLALLFFGALSAQSSGKITGVVTDKVTGEALPGVNVVVEGSRLGASTDVDGFFVILNVPVGTHNVKFNYVGYAETTIQDVRVYVDNATEVNVELQEEVNVGDVVVVVAKRALIRKEETNSRQIRTSDEIKNLPVNSVQEIVGLTAGVVKSDNSNTLNVRGGRGAETAIMVDGLVQNSAYDGSVNGTLNRNAVEEVTVQSGNFSARYSNALSGLVQTSIKSGSDKYSFSFEAQSDKAGPKASRYGYTDYNFTASGPIVPGTQNYFFISVGKNWQDDVSPSWGFKGVQPNPSEELSFAANIKSQITDNILLKLTTTYNLIDNDGFIYGKSFLEGTTKQQHRGITETSNLSNSLTMTHTVSKDFYYELRAGYKEIRNESYDSKWKKNLLAYGIADLNKYNGSDVTGEEIKKYGSVTDGQTARLPGTLTSDADDDLNFGTMYVRNGSVTGIRSINRVFNAYSKDFEGNIDLALNLSYTYDLHQIAAGFSYNRAKMHRYSIAPVGLVKPDFGTQIVVNDRDYFNQTNQNVFGYDYLGNWSEDGDYLNGADEENWNRPNEFGKLKPKTPYQMSLYVEDVLRVDEFFINLGVRWDYFNPNQEQFKDIDNFLGDGSDTTSLGRIVDSKDLIDSEAYTEISPRLGISFPVTENTKFAASIGRFVQMPTYNQMMTNLRRWSIQNFGSTFGNSANPNLKPQKSVQYEMSINHTLNEDMALGVRTYFRQITDLITSQLIGGDNGVDKQLMTWNDDNSTNKGLELTLETRRINNYQIFASYTYSTAFGTGSGSGSSVRLARNDIKSSFQNALDYDVPHKANLNFDYRFSDGQGPSLFGTKILQNFGANISFSYQSGLPYTTKDITNSFEEVVNRDVEARSDINELSMPSRTSIDLRLDKTFNINVGSQNLNLNFYVDVRNLFDTEKVQDVHRGTGLPDTDGYLEQAQSWNDDVTDNVYKRSAYKYLIQRPAFWGNPRLIRFGMRINL
jgi:outer membrane receptor protein involved in Fe transport